MHRCKKPGCGSYQFNLHRDGVDQGWLCDVHYWQCRAETARRDALEDAANKFDGTTAYNPTAADGYANAADIAAELRYMATEMRLNPSVFRAHGRTEDKNMNRGIVKGVLVSETEIISAMGDMCAESLSPDLYEAWESVRVCLEETRSALCGPTEPETANVEVHTDLAAASLRQSEVRVK